MKKFHAGMDAIYGKVRMYGELQAIDSHIGIHRVRTSMKRLGPVAIALSNINILLVA